jgi:hypothetical protein
MSLVAQLVGFFGLFLNIVAFQQKKRKYILFLMIGTGAAFAIHFALLEAWVGALMNVVAFGRAILFEQRTKKKWADNIFWLLLVLLLFWVSGLSFYEGIVSLLPPFAMSIESSGLWMKNEKLIRALNLFPHPLWFIYNYSVGSIAGMVAAVVVFTSVVIGIVRHDLLNKK